MPTRKNFNASKPGEDLRIEMFLSKPRRALFEEFCLLKFHLAPNEDELRARAREIAYAAIDRECLRALTRPGKELLVELHLPETTTTLFTEYFRLKFGHEPTQEELQATAQRLFQEALKQEMITEIELHQPGKISKSQGESF